MLPLQTDRMRSARHPKAWYGYAGGIQTLTLCVRYGNNPGSCAEMLFVTAEGKQGVRGTPEHQPVQQLLIFINQAVKLIRNCENGMIVSNSLYEFGIAFHDPFLLNRSLTAGTVLRSKAMAVQVLRQELLKSITDGVRRIICQGHRDFSHSFHCRYQVRGRLPWRKEICVPLPP